MRLGELLKKNSHARTLFLLFSRDGASTARLSEWLSDLTVFCDAWWTQTSLTRIRWRLKCPARPGGRRDAVTIERPPF